MPGKDTVVLLREARERGFSTIPVNRDKRPRFSWKVYQERLPTADELNDWWKQRPDAWAVVAGAISGAVILDFDGHEGLATLQMLTLRPHVLTGSGGAHVYFQHPGWPVKTLNCKSKHELGQKYAGMDIRADGGYAVFAGRNQSGEYEWLRDMEPDRLEVLPLDLREFLGLLTPEVDATAAQRIAGEVLVQRALALINGGRGRNDAGFWLAVQLRDNGYTEDEAIAVMDSYRSHTPLFNAKGEVESYTVEESLHSVRQAFRKAVRLPWTSRAQSKVTEIELRSPSPAPTDGERSLPTIVASDRELRDVSSDVIEALRAANNPPELFVRTGQMVNVAQDEDGRHSIREVTEAFLRGRMSRCANFCRVWGREGMKSQSPTNPPIDVVRDVLALSSVEWQFPALETVTEAPLLRPDGTVLLTPGYDALTRVFYPPNPDLPNLQVPDDPITDEITEAVVTLDEALEGFPFVDEASRANAYAMLLTPMLRRAVFGNVPIALIDAPEAGTGKSLLAELVAIIHTGVAAAMKPTPSRDEEEWRKTLSAVLLVGNALTIFDNITYRLDSPSLALAVTASTWTDRLLGQTRTITVPQRTTWIATGNNIMLGGDIPRRCYWIRLDARTPQPWQRSGFRIPDLRQWARDNRSRLLSALLTMSRAWYSAGRPESKAPILGSFEHWSRIVGGILSYAGIEGFLSNLESLYEQSDPSHQQWEAFLDAIYDQFEGDSFTAHELVELIRQGEPISKSLPDDLPDEERKGNSFQRRIAHAFRQRHERRYGPFGLHLVKAGEARNKVVLWQVKKQKS
ncbi:MAG: bifunctional DNA primase/polymerase [Acidobacteriales bacterium]|nr:bifunctional DNA primase/polymerase [Terriglobales bacterium]